MDGFFKTFVSLTWHKGAEGDGGASEIGSGAGDAGVCDFRRFLDRSGRRKEWKDCQQ